jgi:hypothetical protein
MSHVDGGPSYNRISIGIEQRVSRKEFGFDVILKNFDTHRSSVLSSRLIVAHFDVDEDTLTFRVGIRIGNT